ncbi:hypothetical protein GCM10007315_07000 [Gemmobacter tilapiae]|uniref:Uncharacterized protein n=2 Tax=Neogemmobacter tilapiae TaxID=875041 RepID=A0A918WHW0_9RHOB|nr:hypothetical protein GCM10007315_07000 [Gemmobacter tilapiae]
MQLVRNFAEDSIWVARPMRVVYLSAADLSEIETMAIRLSGLGAGMSHAEDTYAAVEMVMDHPGGFGLLIADCDSLGGIEEGDKLFRMLGESIQQLPVILTATDLAEQVFPTDKSAPIRLRAPLTPVALRLGIEHAARSREAMTA